MCTFAELLDLAIADEPDAGACLISKQPLDYSRVALRCGHEFNYQSIFHHLLFAKSTRYTKHTTSGIECPYCRVKTPHLLPMCKLPDGTIASSRQGINSPTWKALPEYRCTWTSASAPNGGGVTCVTCQCAAPGVLHPGGVHCKKHLAAFNRLEKRKEQQEQRQKQKQAAMQAKQAAKQAKQAAKQAEKEKAKQAKARETRLARLTKTSDSLSKRHGSLQEKLEPLLEKMTSECCTKAVERRVKSLAPMAGRLQNQLDALKAEWAAFRQEP